MASLISAATGDFTASGTWKVASAVANAEVDSEVGTFGVTNSNSDSASFVPAATGIDAIAIKIASYTTPTGTFTVKLRNSTTSTDAATVTVNVGDIKTNGWHVFSFGTVTPNGTDSYVVRLARSVVDSGSNRITVYSSTAAVATTISRMIRLVTNAAPAANDKLVVAGELTGAGTNNTYTVTMDNTATTSFGSTTPSDGICVNSYSTLSYGVAASTNYYLKYKGRFSVFDGATFNIGTTGTPIPSTSTAVLEMDSASNVDTGLYVQLLGVFNAQGASLTYDRAKLAADASASATSLTTDVSTGWLNGDEIALASTTRTASECEKKSLSAGASGTTLTIAALTNAHSGTNSGGYDTRAELANLTRNVKIRGISDTLQGYIRFGSTSTVDMDWVEMSRLGSATATKTGVYIPTTTGSCSINRCSFRDFIVTGSYIGLIGSCDNITLSNNVFYNINANFISIDAATTGTNITIDNNLGIRTVGSVGYALADIGITFTNNTSAGAANHGIYFNQTGAVLGTFSGNVSHSNANGGFYAQAYIGGGTISNSTAWRNSAAGLNTNNGCVDTLWDGFTAFGNSTNNITFGNQIDRCIFKNFTVNSGTTLTTATGLNFSGTSFGINNKLVDSNFGSVTAHSTADIVGNASVMTLVMHNTILASSTEFSGQTSIFNGSFVSSQKHDQTAGSHKTWTRYGILSIDTTIYNSLSPSARMTPNNASFKMYSSVFFAPVANGTTSTFQVNVRKSAAGDGTAYNGSQPRLMLKANPALGVSADTVIATYSAGTGSWNTLSGSSPTATDDGVWEFYIDCDGTQGWINYDDVTCGVPYPSGLKYWLNGQPYADGIIAFPTTESTYTFGG